MKKKKKNSAKTQNFKPCPNKIRVLKRNNSKKNIYGVYVSILSELEDGVNDLNEVKLDLLHSMN